QCLLALQQELKQELQKQVALLLSQQVQQAQVPQQQGWPQKRSKILLIHQQLQPGEYLESIAVNGQPIHNLIDVPPEGMTMPKGQPQWQQIILQSSLLPQEKLLQQPGPQSQTLPLYLSNAPPLFQSTRQQGPHFQIPAITQQQVLPLNQQQLHLGYTEQLQQQLQLPPQIPKKGFEYALPQVRYQRQPPFDQQYLLEQQQELKQELQKQVALLPYQQQQQGQIPQQQGWPQKRSKILLIHQQLQPDEYLESITVDGQPIYNQTDPPPGAMYQMPPLMPQQLQPDSPQLALNMQPPPAHMQQFQPLLVPMQYPQIPLQPDDGFTFPPQIHMQPPAQLAEPYSPIIQIAMQPPAEPFSQVPFTANPQLVTYPQMQTQFQQMQSVQESSKPIIIHHQSLLPPGQPPKPIIIHHQTPNMHVQISSTSNSTTSVDQAPPPTGAFRPHRAYSPPPPHYHDMVPPSPMHMHYSPPPPIQEYAMSPPPPMRRPRRFHSMPSPTMMTTSIMPSPATSMMMQPMIAQSPPPPMMMPNSMSPFPPPMAASPSLSATMMPMMPPMMSPMMPQMMPSMTQPMIPPVMPPMMLPMMSPMMPPP
ncbi:low-molecular-weight glutenin subunit group 3 type II, putative, partial [Ixodes scapularis]